MADSKKLVNNIKLTAIILTIITVALILHFSLKTARDETCYTNTYTDYDNTETYNGTKLKQDGYLLQQFSTIGDDNKKLSFCYEVTSNDNQTHQVSIINQLSTVLGKDVVLEGRVCTKIILYDNQPNQYLGVLCDDCNDTSYLFVNKALSGVNVKQITRNNTFVDKTAAYTLNGFEGCSRGIKTIYHWYLLLIGMLSLVLVISYFAFDKLEGVLFKGW